MKEVKDKQVKKITKLISEKYATENGKKFVLHLVSAFIADPSKVTRLTSANVGKYSRVQCCITKTQLVPSDVYVPQTEGTVSYGWTSAKSDKLLSDVAIDALIAFIRIRIEAGDNVLVKIQNYLDKRMSKPNSESTGVKAKEVKPKTPKTEKVVTKSKAESEDIQAIPSI